MMMVAAIVRANKEALLVMAIKHLSAIVNK